MGSRHVKWWLGGLVAVCVPALAVAVTLPTTFQNDQRLTAASLNGNFAALATAVNALEAQVGRCPSGMVALGSGCIDVNAHDPLPFFREVPLACHQEGKRVCSAQELYTCDHINLSTSECNAMTDTAGTQIWVGDLQVGENNGLALMFVPNQIVVEDWTVEAAFFCCIPSR